MRKTQTSSAVRMRYREKAYESINFDVPKGRKAELDAHLKAQGLTVSGFLNQCIREELGIPKEEWKTYRPRSAEAQNRNGEKQNSAGRGVRERDAGTNTPPERGGGGNERTVRRTREESWLMRD